MPKYGLLTSSIKPITQQIDDFMRLGFDYVEIGIEEPLGVPEKLLKEKGKITGLIKKYGTFALGHTPYWLQFGSALPAVRNGWISEARLMIDTAHALDIEYLNFHFNCGAGQTLQAPVFRKTFLRRFAASMKELCRYAEKKGITLMLENKPPYSKTDLNINDYAYIMKSVPDLMVHLDIPHAFVEGRMDSVAEYIRTFKDRLVHIHMHDNDGTGDQHLPLGKGKIDIGQVVRLLKEIDYDRTITFEVFTSYGDATASRDMFKRLWADA